MPRLYEDTLFEEEIKKSRFITYLHRCQSEAEARDFIKMIRRLHPDAAHHCSAYIVGSIAHSSDDGEPAGTAGRPMLEVLQKKNMDQICAVVVRYFGGTLLGKGGLVRAYSSGIIQALNQATLSEIQPLQVYSLEFGYDLLAKVDAFIRRSHLEILESDYGEKVTYLVASPTDLTDGLKAAVSGRIQPEFVEITEKETPLFTHQP